MDSLERRFRGQYVNGACSGTRPVVLSRREDRHWRVRSLHSLSLCSSTTRPAWSHSRARDLRGSNVDPRRNRLRGPRLERTNHRSWLHRKPAARFSFTLRLVENETRLHRSALVQSPRNGTRFASILCPRSWHSVEIHNFREGTPLCIEFPPA